jgi:hypothetical protein
VCLCTVPATLNPDPNPKPDAHPHPHHHPSPGRNPTHRHLCAGVFIDYCSLPQPAPMHAPAHLTRGVTLPERTEEETRRFLFALAEMSRMYAYGGCDVVVLKESRLPEDFPDGSGEALFRAGATVELDGSDVWLLAADGQRSQPQVCVRDAATCGDGQRATLGSEIKGKIGEKVVQGRAAVQPFRSKTAAFGVLLARSRTKIAAGASRSTRLLASMTESSNLTTRVCSKLKRAVHGPRRSRRTRQ